jgi:acetoacetyl-CoA synthetase
MIAPLVRQPTAPRPGLANLEAFGQLARTRYGLEITDEQDITRWSIDHPEQFWAAVWSFCDVRGDLGRPAQDPDAAPGIHPAGPPLAQARLNVAQNLLRRRDDGIALTFWGEDKLMRRLSHGDLYRRVARLAAAIQGNGVKAGDVVAAWMPNMPETVITLLACAAIGAIFTAVSPDTPVRKALDALGPVQPRLLFLVDGYYDNGKTQDMLGKGAELVAQLPCIEGAIVSRYVQGHGHDLSGLRQGMMLRPFVDPFRYITEIDFASLPFDHPLLLTEAAPGTTEHGSIVHRAGTTLLESVYAHQVQGDMRPGDRLFCPTSCNTDAWYRLVFGLASQASVMLYDGNPFLNAGSILFDYAMAEGMTHWAASSDFLRCCIQKKLVPAESHDLKKLRGWLVTDTALDDPLREYLNTQINRSMAIISPGDHPAYPS